MHKKIAGEPMEELYSQLAALARRYGRKAARAVRFPCQRG